MFKVKLFFIVLFLLILTTYNVNAITIKTKEINLNHEIKEVNYLIENTSNTEKNYEIKVNTPIKTTYEKNIKIPAKGKKNFKITFFPLPGFENSSYKASINFKSNKENELIYFKINFLKQEQCPIKTQIIKSKNNKTTLKIKNNSMQEIKINEINSKPAVKLNKKEMKLNALEEQEIEIENNNEKTIIEFKCNYLGETLEKKIGVKLNKEKNINSIGFISLTISTVIDGILAIILALLLIAFFARLNKIIKKVIK